MGARLTETASGARPRHGQAGRAGRAHGRRGPDAPSSNAQRIVGSGGRRPTEETTMDDFGLICFACGTVTIYERDAAYPRACGRCLTVLREAPRGAARQLARADAGAGRASRRIATRVAGPDPRVEPSSQQ
jgi:hypothetical protein